VQQEEETAVCCLWAEHVDIRAINFDAALVWRDATGATEWPPTYIPLKLNHARAHM